METKSEVVFNKVDSWIAIGILFGTPIAVGLLAVLRVAIYGV